MQITMAGDYAVRSILHLVINQDRSPISLSEISKEQCIPKNFLYKVMQTLIQRGFVISHMGSSGGYALARDPKEITLREVVEAVEGPIYLNRCIMRPGMCPRDNYCSVHSVWHEVQNSLMSTLESYKMDHLATKLKKNMASTRK